MPHQQQQVANRDKSQRTVFVLGLLLLSFLFVKTASASQTQGTIVGATHYAWAENLGWINFAPSTAGLTITDIAITGYVWSPLGWINFNPTNSGVHNTPEGVLSGSAWVAGLGWLDMTGITISPEGKFTGIAGDEESAVGRISFDCAHCNVVTDWRPEAFRTKEEDKPVYIAQGTGYASTTRALIYRDLGLPSLPAGTVESVGSPVSVPSANRGLFLQRFGPDSVAVEVPVGAYDDTLTINIVQRTASTTYYGKGTFIMSGVVYDITAQDSSGRSVHTFKKPLTITLSIPEQLNTKDLGVYWFDEQQQHWVLVPNATFTSKSVSFMVDHLTRFALFSAQDKPSIIIEDTQLQEPKMVALKKLWWLGILVAGTGFIFYFAKKKRSKGNI